MNALQHYLENMKAEYSRRLAANQAPRLQEIMTLVQLKRPLEQIRNKILAYCSNMNDLYCRLLLANLEGEILLILKNDERNTGYYEALDTTCLFESWNIPDYLPAARYPQQLSLSSCCQKERAADPLDADP